jgi:signal peptidase I
MAAGMSLILPGFGQLYNGMVNRGLLVFMAFTLVTLPLVLWVTFSLPTSMTLALLILTVMINAGIWIYGIVDAWKTAKTNENYILKDWQLPAVYLLIFLSAIFYFVPSMSQYMRTNLVESFSVPSVSMAPSVLQGDILFANKNYNCVGCAQATKRGDIAIFINPNNRTQYYIKRIVGLPGDRIRIEGHQVMVNSVSLSKGDVDETSNVTFITEKAGNIEYQVQYNRRFNKPLEEFIVPNGEVFVLGDNRNNSKDSRHFGTVPLQDVVGKASQVWMSRSEDGFRWERLGLVLK